MKIIKKRIHLTAIWKKRKGKVIMNHEKKVIRQYLKEVKKELNCSMSVKSVFLKDLKEEIAFSRTQGLTITGESLRAEFGSPEEISASFYNRSDYKELLAKAKKKLFFWRISAGIAIFTAVLFGAAIIFFLVHVFPMMSGGITVTRPY